MAAPQLIWECVKGGNSSIRKNIKDVKFPVMSAEAGNLCGLHSYKFSGIASKQVLDVTVQNKKTIVMVTSHKKSSRTTRPGARFQTTGLKKEGKKGAAQVSK